MKIRYIFLILTMTLLVAIWTGRTHLAEFALSSGMQYLGLTNVSTDIHQLDPTENHISRFEFTLVNEKGRFQLKAHDINMRYNFEQLKDGRVDNITVNKLVLHHEKTSYTQEVSPDAHEALEPLKIIVALRQALRKYIIFNTFAVQQITMHGDAFGALQDKPLRLNGINKDGALYAEISLLNDSSPGQQKHLQQLVITRLTADSLAAELRSSATPDTVAAKLELTINNTEKLDTDTINTVISGNYHIDPAQLQHWLQAITIINDIDKIKTIQGTLKLNFNAADQIITTITANSEKIVFNPYSADKVAIKLKINNPVTNPLQHTQIQNGSYIKFSNVNYENFSLGESRINMVGELSTATDVWNVKGGLSSSLFTVNHESQTLKLKDIAARITANTEKLEIAGNFSPANVPGKFVFSLNHNLMQKLGQLTLKSLQAINLNAENSKLSLLLTPWPYPFDLLAGNIKLASQATWSQKNDFKLTTKIKLEDAGGTIAKEIVFSGLTLEHELELLPKLHSIRKSKIKLKHLDSGVTSSNITTSLTLQTASSGPLPKFAVQDLHGEIFSGSFSSDDFVFDLNKNKNKFKIKATNIDLAKIIETQQLEDIVVTGRVDGIIPVEINEQGIFIEHGALVNDVRAGSIRYNPGAGTDQLKQNPLTGIALDALKDFRYSHLSADVNFTPEGTLTINLQLKGTSPELDTNRPVHLNINTEQNLTALLKSLRFAQGVSENIDKKVRHQYEKNKTKN